MRHPSLEKWEDKLRKIFYQIDDILEDKYGGLYPLKPGRKPRGVAPTNDADGLFDLGVNFSGGFGSQLGPGYVFRVGIATLEHIPPTVRAEIESFTIELIREKLKEAFPENELSVSRDGNIFKIYGDLSLN